MYSGIQLNLSQGLRNHKDIFFFEILVEQSAFSLAIRHAREAEAEHTSTVKSEPKSCRSNRVRGPILMYRLLTTCFTV
jgi:hypothetical protein